MSRPFQTWTRAEISDRYRQIEYEKNAINSKIAEVEAVVIDVSDLRAKPQFTPAMIEMAQTARRSQLLIELNQRHQACSEGVLALNIELRIRNDPELVAQFGPGAD